MSSSDIRHYAYERLRGKWGISILVALVVSALGGNISGSPSFSINYRISNNSSSAQVPQEQLYIILWIILAVFAVVWILALTYQVLVSNVVRVGYARFLLNVVDEDDYRFIDLFQGFKNYKSAVAVGFRKYITIFLYTLLFIIPGIIATYNYAMVPYIQAEHPEYSPEECMQKSKSMMYGNRWRLFCLELSFFGWALLTVLTCGVGSIWLTPYMETAYAVFYRSISTGLRPVVPNVIDAE